MHLYVTLFNVLMERQKIYASHTMDVFSFVKDTIMWVTSTWQEILGFLDLTFYLHWMSTQLFWIQNPELLRILNLYNTFMVYWNTFWSFFCLVFCLPDLFVVRLYFFYHCGSSTLVNIRPPAPEGGPIYPKNP